MATLPPGRLVLLDDDALRRLRFPPPSSEAVIAVHAAALRAPENTLTLAVCLDADDAPVWVGAIDEAMVLGGVGKTVSPRAALGRRLLTGRRCWDIVWPGPLTAGPGPFRTVYAGDRPWVVLGALASGSLLAAPLNDARGNPKWYAPVIAAAALEGAAAKDGQLELAHLWSLPEGLPGVGEVGEGVRGAVGEAVRRYYG